MKYNTNEECELKEKLYSYTRKESIKARIVEQKQTNI